MDELKTIYDLNSDEELIKMVQATSLDQSSAYGLKIKNGILFGTNEWFAAIDFEIKESSGALSIWSRKGTDSAYKVGRAVKLTYVEQEYKRPSDVLGSISKSVIQICIGDVMNNH